MVPRPQPTRQDREGINNLAVMLDQGLGVAADRDAAMKLFRKSSARTAKDLQHSTSRSCSCAIRRRRNAQLQSVHPARNERLIDAYAWLNVAASLGPSGCGVAAQLAGSRLNSPKGTSSRRSRNPSNLRHADHDASCIDSGITR
jgi:TPR repeat protein